ncbi:hypothetical protein B0H10DRAFT_2445017 [Mycena sp. CBHHK59/15]|nr:hypothetical protein B0H10DRAFT_2445017 [Mycena sp. CBHHK59/15]
MFTLCVNFIHFLVGVQWTSLYADCARHSLYWCRLLSPNLQPLSHQHGSTFIADDVLWYSPNTLRRPPPVPSPSFVYTDKTRLKELSQPQFWDSQRPWIPFIPLRGAFELWPSGSLENISIVEPSEDTFQLDPKTLRLWLDLEKNCNRIVKILLSQLFGREAFCLGPLGPSEVTGFRKHYLTYSQALHESVLARERFVLLFAYISYLISIPWPQPTSIPPWFHPCASAGVPQALLSSITECYMGCFTLAHPRIGVFHHIFIPHNDSPNISFYARRGVPVWYRWGPAESEHVSAANLRGLQPPLHLVTMASSSMWGIRMVWESPISQLNTFFSSRDARYAKMLSTPRQDLLWAERKRLPPLTAPLKVFRWFLHAGVVMCRPVDPRFALNVLHQSDPQHVRYDSRANEWDVCPLFESDQYILPEYDWDIFNVSANVKDVNQSPQMYEQVTPRIAIDYYPNDEGGFVSNSDTAVEDIPGADASVATDASVDLPILISSPSNEPFEQVDTLTVLSVLTQRFGFTRDFSGPALYSSDSVVDADRWSGLLDILGLPHEELPPTHLPSVILLIPASYVLRRYGQYHPCKMQITWGVRAGCAKVVWLC